MQTPIFCLIPKRFVIKIAVFHGWITPVCTLNGCTGMPFHQYGLVWSKYKIVASVLFFPFVFRLYHFLRFFQLGLLLTNGKPSLLSQCLPHCSHRTLLLTLSFLPSFCPFWFWSAYAKQCPQLFLASRFCVRLFKESHHKRLFIKSIPMI